MAPRKCWSRHFGEKDAQRASSALTSLQQPSFFLCQLTVINTNYLSIATCHIQASGQRLKQTLSCKEEHTSANIDNSTELL